MKRHEQIPSRPAFINADFAGRRDRHLRWGSGTVGGRHVRRGGEGNPVCEPVTGPRAWELPASDDFVTVCSSADWTKVRIIKLRSNGAKFDVKLQSGSTCKVKRKVVARSKVRAAVEQTTYADPTERLPLSTGYKHRMLMHK